MAAPSLSPQQKQWLVTRQIEGTLLLAEWLELLTPISQIDQQGAARRKKLGSFGCLLIVLAFVAGGLFFVFWPAYRHRIDEGWVWLAVFLWVGAVAATWIDYYRSKLTDIPDNLYQFVMPVLRFLQADIEASQPVTLSIRLDFPKHSSTSQTAPTQRMGRYQCTDTFFTLPWLTLETRFSDKTNVRVEIVDRMRSRKKESTRKIKYRYKTKSLIQANLGFLNSTYQPHPHDKLPVGVQKTSKDKGKRFHVMLAAKHTFPGEACSAYRPENLLDLLMAGYQHVQKSP